jgi:competence protein ComEA
MRAFLLVLLSIAFAAKAWAAGIDLNTADASALETLPGIGASKAAAIIQYRTDNGPFKTVDELDNVSGIGPSTLASVRDLVAIGPATGKPEASSSTKPAAAPAATTAAAAPAAASTSTSAEGCPVNINTADTSGLMNLPGIGESKATAILQYRTDHGAFASCSALDDVSGIGPATVTAIGDCCKVK